MMIQFLLRLIDLGSPIKAYLNKMISSIKGTINIFFMNKNRAISRFQNVNKFINN